MRNPEYAALISTQLNGIVRKTESELLGVIPKDDDCFIIDLHYTGLFSDLDGLKIGTKLSQFSKYNIKIILYSWLPENYLKNNYPLTVWLQKSNVQFKQFPIQ